jgi:hypothetical protein
MHLCGACILPDLGQPGRHLIAVIFKVILHLCAQLTCRLQQLYAGLARRILVPFLPITLSLAAIPDGRSKLGNRSPSDGSACRDQGYINGDIGHARIVAQLGYRSRAFRRECSG